MSRHEIHNTEKICRLPISELKPFDEQPFKVLIDESMDELVESIKDNGVVSPIIARPHKDGGYEILSGHRRAAACKIAGKEDVPVIVKNLDDDMAAILLVDSNLQRENILPSERAYAYKLKLEAMKHQGERTDLTSAQVVPKLSARERVAQEAGVNRMAVTRYIRLTELIDPLLDMVDSRRLPLNAAVELSYLGSKAQADVVKIIEKHESVPSIEQAAKMRKFSNEGRLSYDVIDSIMLEQKPEKIRVTLKEDRLREYFPESYSKKQMEDTIMKLLKNWARKRKEPER